MQRYMRWGCVFLLSLLFALQVITAHDFRGDVPSEKYAIQLKVGDIGLTKGTTVEEIQAGLGKYKCKVPIPSAVAGTRSRGAVEELERSTIAGNSSGKDDEGDRAGAETQPQSEKRREIFSHCVTMNDGGWFLYEVCPYKHVRQYHAQGQSVTAEFYLGKYVATEEASESNGNRGVQEFDDGTLCDLTQVPRKTKVEYHCIDDEVKVKGVFMVTEPGKEIPRFSVEEVETCSYLIRMYTAGMCAGPSGAVKDPITDIDCLVDGNFDIQLLQELQTIEGELASAAVEVAEEESSI